MQRLLVTTFFIFILLSVDAASLQYTLRFPEPQTHYVEVELQVDQVKGSRLNFNLPVWAPGSYLIREFSRHVDSFTAMSADGKILPYQKTDKNTWEVSGIKGACTIRYKVYAYELTVRTSYIDEEHAYLNGTSIFMYPDNMIQRPCTVTVVPFAGWMKMSVALEAIDQSRPWTVTAPDYDVLADSPFEIGNHEVISFTAAGIPHELALFGKANYVGETLTKDISRIVEECTSVFGENPCKRYLFIIHNIPSGGGGLEHLNSTTLQTNRSGYTPGKEYQGFLSLVAHEYFHLWNVKRLRPQPLGPFDYNEENYTRMLYIAEGFTAYYDDLIVRRCGFSTVDEYLGSLAGNLSYTHNQAGAKIQSLSESSLDAWIKFYRPYENSNNTTVSYYTKGAAVGALLDLTIRKASSNQSNLDQVFRDMYREYYKKLDRAYSEREFIEMVNRHCKKDMSDFFNRYVNSTDSIPLKDYLEAAGLTLTDLNMSSVTPWLGMSTSVKEGKLTLTAVDRNSPSWTSGVTVNDEIIAINGLRTTTDLKPALANVKPGDVVNVLVSRSGDLKEFRMKASRTPYVRYELKAGSDSSPEQISLRKSWLRE